MSIAIAQRSRDRIILTHDSVEKIRQLVKQNRVKYHFNYRKPRKLDVCIPFTTYVLLHIIGIVIWGIFINTIFTYLN